MLKASGLSIYGLDLQVISSKPWTASVCGTILSQQQYESFMLFFHQKMKKKLSEGGDFSFVGDQGSK